MSRHHRAGPPAGVRPDAPPPARRRWWRELLLVILGYWSYTLVRNAVPDQAGAATRNADRIYRLEQALGIDVELAVNVTLDRITWLIVGMNYYYAVAHFAVTIAGLVWLYRRHPRHYPLARNVFLVTNGVALSVFYLFPLAPPRLLPRLGFVDTVIVHGTWGSWASGDLAAASNQYAAMPSMHVAWSLFSAVVIVRLARRWWVRGLAALHPVLTLVVIVATANHFVLDAAGGAAALGAGYAIPVLAVAVRRRRRTRRPPLPRQPAPADREPAEPAEVAGAPA